jgi:hypothetical protein
VLPRRGNLPAHDGGSVLSDVRPVRRRVLLRQSRRQGGDGSGSRVEQPAPTAQVARDADEAALGGQHLMSSLLFRVAGDMDLLDDAAAEVHDVDCRGGRPCGDLRV